MKSKTLDSLEALWDFSLIAAKLIQRFGGSRQIPILFETDSRAHNGENPNREKPSSAIWCASGWLTNDYQRGIYTIYRLLAVSRVQLSASVDEPPSPSLPLPFTRPLQFLPRTARNKASSLKARQMHFTRESGSRVTRIKVLLHAGGASERRQESSRARRLGRRRQRTDDADATAYIQRSADN